MRLLSLLLLILTVAEANPYYELQLFATKSNNFQGIKRMLQKGHAAGLECYIAKEKRVDGIYSFVRCEKTENYDSITESMKMAEDAKLRYYLLKPNSNVSVSKPAVPIQTITHESEEIEPSEVSALSRDDNLNSYLFGKNQELINILYNKNNVSKEYLAQRRAQYLKNIEDKERFNGLYLRGNGSKNFNKDRYDYNFRLQWELFDGGFFGTDKNAKRAVLQKELEYDRILDDYKSSNLKLAMYKMYAIDNLISVVFLKQQEQILSYLFDIAKKKYKASLLTASAYLKQKNSYMRVKRIASYYESMEIEKYDVALKLMMEHIEDLDISNRDGLIENAYANSFALKNIENKMKLSTLGESWLDRFKTSVYVENSKFLYLNDSDNAAGIQVKMPLDFNNKKGEIQESEIEVQQLKYQSLRALIARSIDDIYHKIDYLKNSIHTIKSDISFLKDEQKRVQLMSRYPLASQSRDSVEEKAKIDLDISKHYQQMWKQKTEILKLLLKLQHLSGVQVLPS